MYTSEFFDSVVTRVPSPDGTVFVNVMEKNGEPAGVILNIGKAGGQLQAWAAALSAMITLSFKRGVKLEEVLTELSSLTSDRSARDRSTTARSGPEAVYIGLMEYRRAKFEDMKKELGTATEDWYGPSIDSRT